jgi:hypothetical protein
VSILNRLTAGHLDDAALAELWTSQAAGSTEVITNTHLAECAECRVRFSAFATWMADLRTESVAEADEAFPAERLAAQQAQIFRRLEAAERPARVIAFPKYPVSATGQASRLHRWIAMSAAAGLIVGVGLGQLLPLRQLATRPTFVASQPSPDTRLPADDAAIDASMMDEIDAAAATPRYEALRAFDTATPRAADFVTSSR